MTQGTRAKLSDVANQAQVSPTTASLILSGKGQRFPQTTRDRIAAIAQKLGYRPHPLARARGKLANRKEQEGLHVAFLFLHREELDWQGLFYPYSQRTMAGLEREIHQHNQLLIPISVKHDGQENPDTIPNLLLSQDVDAAVIMGEVSTRTICTFFRTREIPTVIVDNKVGCSEFGYVCLDNLAGARAAAEHLLAQGYPRLVVIGGKTQITDQQPRSDSRERLEGVVLALAAAGRSWDEKLLYKDEFVTPGGGQRGAAELLDRWGTPLGIVCFDDLFAWQALKECQRRGLKVPEDVGIVGFDDIRSVTELTTPTISSVRVPWEQVGYVAGRLVLEELKRPKQDQSLVVCPVALVARESSNLRHAPVAAGPALPQEPVNNPS